MGMTCGHHNRHLSCPRTACLSLVGRHQMTVLLGDPAPIWQSSSCRHLLSRASVCSVQSQNTLQGERLPERSDTSHHRKVGTPASRLSKLTKSMATPVPGLSKVPTFPVVNKPPPLPPQVAGRTCSFCLTI